MRKYEAMFIFLPQLEEDKLDKEIKAVEKIIKDKGEGEIQVENLGKRTFAYKVEKQNEGFYVNYTFDAPPSAILKIKEDLKHRGNILRYVLFLKEKEK